MASYWNVVQQIVNYLVDEFGMDADDARVAAKAIMSMARYVDRGETAAGTWRRRSY